jgi:hypothetical protein
VWIMRGTSVPMSRDGGANRDNGGVLSASGSGGRTGGMRLSWALVDAPAFDSNDLLDSKG